MVSVLDVARRAGVSSATVSRVISGSPLVTAETRARVLAAAGELGYQRNAFARNLRTGRGTSIALVTGDIEHGIYPALAKHMQSELEKTGYDLLLFNLGHQQERLHDLLRRAVSMGLRGIFIASADIPEIDTLKPLIDQAIAKGIAVLSVSQRLEGHGVSSIVHDDRAGSRMAVEHLLDRGCRNIAVLSHIRHSAVGSERAAGYQDALVRAGLPLQPDLVWDIVDGFRGEAGYRLTTTAIDQGCRFDGIVAASDELAIGAIAALRDRGRDVPGEVAVTGFGGIEWGRYVRPALSTVALDVVAMAEQARSWLEAFDAGTLEQVTEIRIKPRFIAREST